jgi:pyruvate/2-oxoglutarate dehydrogenase complex dihydrolipoamide dehydrogenase (E3) component
MTHLRSPSVHNLDLNPWSLKQYGGKRKRRKPGLFAPPYDRPNLTFFNDHCDKVIGDFNLNKLHVRARATSCEVACDGVAVGLSTGTEISTCNVVLAIGAGEQPKWPEWAPRDDARVHHIFDPDFDGWPSGAESVVVVGGGISAGQVALRLVEEGHEVHLVSRHALREHQFDSDPGWLGPRFMAGFLKEKDVDQRRMMISQARHKGSVSPDVRRALRGAITRQQVQWHQSGVDGIGVHDDGLRMRLATGTILEVQRVLLATGFAGHRPGGALIDQLAESASLPCASCGYPIVDKALRWHPRVYVSGPLAELELGPSSRNISGARRAAERLVAAVRSPVAAGA